jgi:hypothetical protein
LSYTSTHYSSRLIQPQAKLITPVGAKPQEERLLQSSYKYLYKIELGKNVTDEVKNTIRQTSSYTTPEINIKGLINEIYTNLQDEAKPTIKQTWLLFLIEMKNISRCIKTVS